MKTPEGRALYAKRKSVETVFGVVKEVMGFRRFHLRGLERASGPGVHGLEREARCTWPSPDGGVHRAGALPTLTALRLVVWWRVLFEHSKDLHYVYSIGYS